MPVDTPDRSKIKHRFSMPWNQDHYDSTGTIGCKGKCDSAALWGAHGASLATLGGNWPAGPLGPPWLPHSTHPGIPMAVFTINKCATGTVEAVRTFDDYSLPRHIMVDLMRYVANTNGASTVLAFSYLVGRKSYNLVICCSMTLP